MFDGVQLAGQPQAFRRDDSAFAMHISSRDMEHLRNFSIDEKARLMRAALMATPADMKSTSGKNEFEKSLLKLRSGGFHLIDMQALEIALTTVWYRKTASLLGLVKAEVVVALDWALDESGAGETTTMRRWSLS